VFVSELTAERLRELLNYDPETGMFTQRVARRSVQVGHTAGYVSKSLGYRYICVDRVDYLAHRLAWLHVHGEWPADMIDHINGDKADNRIENLRQVNNRLNMQNLRQARRGTASGLLGVSRHPGDRWTAGIRLADGTRKYLGIFDTPEEAHEVYLTAKRKLHEGCTI
jgi:hypothetical protein